MFEELVEKLTLYVWFTLFIWSEPLSMNRHKEYNWVKRKNYCFLFPCPLDPSMCLYLLMFKGGLCNISFTFSTTENLKVGPGLFPDPYPVKVF